MAIQWFPGHMHLTQKAIAERIKDIDVVIELLDARLPGSSANPMLAELTGHKPALKVLNKQDLADPDAPRCGWPTTTPSPARARSASTPADHAAARALIAPATRWRRTRGGMAKPMRVLICGIPNVGKSTLINTLTGKRARPRPATRPASPSWSSASCWPTTSTCRTRPACCGRASSSRKSGYNLAASGAIGRNAYDEEEVALELLDTSPALRRPARGALQARRRSAH